MEQLAISETAASDDISVGFCSPLVCYKQSYKDDALIQIQDNIHSTPSHNNSNCDALMYDVDRIVSSASYSDLNLDKIIHSIVVEMFHNSYNNTNFL